MGAFKSMLPKRLSWTGVALVLYIVYHHFVLFSMVESQSQNKQTEEAAAIPSFRGSPSKLQHSRNEYSPAPVEQYIMDHIQELGWNSAKNPPGCMIWTDEQHPLHANLSMFLQELDSYQEQVVSFPKLSADLREQMLEKPKEHVCDTVKLGMNGLGGIFPSGQLSRSSSGYIEPLTTPMRHPRFCWDRKHLMRMDYMVHDFEAMCQQLLPNSRTVLIDMGASLSYHDDQAKGNPLLHAEENPITYLIQLYDKFGIHFDHIYGLEAKFTEPETVFHKLLPPEYLPAYHWINTGVESAKDSPLNPLYSILRHYKETDFVVVKLDIDTASIEVPLVQHLLNDTGLAKLVDQFYFEHHVHMKEMARIWRSAMSGTLEDSFEMFHELRKKGVPAHFWV